MSLTTCLPKTICRIKHKDFIWTLYVEDGVIQFKGELIGMSKLLKYYLLTSLQDEDMGIFKILLGNYLYRTTKKLGRSVMINNVVAGPSKILIKHLLGNSLNSVKCKELI